ncbi:MAG: hypothetical protein JSS20_18310 [Proteobacteria bacterium]|nr:hypothetical protein [Pseudomonadota bacterium]
MEGSTQANGRSSSVEKLSDAQLSTLRLLEAGARQHFEFAKEFRESLPKLWGAQFIKLTAGDIWEITPKGLLLLDAGGAIQE